jgi:hypothetical protein
VHGGTIGQFPAGSGHHLLEQALGALELVLLHSAQTGLIVLHSLLKLGIVGQGALGLGLSFHF